MKLLLVYFVTAFIVLQTPAWALRSSSYTSTLGENEDLKQESSVRYNEDLKDKESSFRDNEELKGQGSSFGDNEELKEQESSSKDNKALKKDSAVKTRSYDTPILSGDD